MVNTRHRAADELQAIMDALAESVAEAPDAEIIEEASELNEELEAGAEHLQARLLETVKAFRQQRLEAARKDYTKAIESIQRTVVDLPKTSRERRALFAAVLARRPDVGGLLTAQYRDLKALTDEDLDSCLRHLGALGVLDEILGAAGRGE
jgi:hypothetical protein